MLKRRFEIFVSSTSELQDERKAIYEEIVRLGHIPAGMENFSAGHRPTWELIEKSIGNADFFVLIVGDRYGSTPPGTEASYTEQEYRYALGLGKPILAVVKDEIDQAEHVEHEHARLLDFRRNLTEKNIVRFFTNDRPFRTVITEELSNWISQHSSDAGGWVRYRELSVSETKRNIYAFLLNRLNPYEDLDITVNALKAVSRLDTIQSLVSVLTNLITDILPRVLDMEVRAYFAYELPEERKVAGSRHPAYQQDFIAQYRIGISSRNWKLGFYIGKNSNVHRVFVSRSPSFVDDATQNRFDGETRNERIDDEGSVCAAPIIWGLGGSQVCVGVVGLSFPQTENVITRKGFKAVVRELSLLFSALFYAFAQQANPPGSADNDYGRQLKGELADYFTELIADE